MVQSLLALVPQIDGLTKRVADLEARIDELTRPPKTPSISSLPPAQGGKPNRAERRAHKRKGRPGTLRGLAANPDRVVATTAQHCPHCAQAAPAKAKAGGQTHWQWVMLSSTAVYHVIPTGQARGLKPTRRGPPSLPPRRR